MHSDTRSRGPRDTHYPSSFQLEVQAGPNPTFPPQWVKIWVNQDEFYALCTFNINYGDGSQILKLTTPLPVQFGQLSFEIIAHQRDRQVG